MKATFILTLLIVLVAMLLLSVRVLTKADGSFRSEHISENKKMRENNISCATSQDRMARRKNKSEVNIKEL